MTSEQACDWCCTPIDAVDRERSEDAGIDEAKAWACIGCIESGRIYQPPNSWEGDPADWPIRNITEHLVLVEENVNLVMADVERTTQLRPRVTVNAYRSVVRIVYAGGWTTPSVTATSNPQALVETAEYLKDRIVEDQAWSSWPPCVLHDIGAVEARTQDREVAWWCNFGNHVVAPVGRFGKADA